MTYDPKLIAEYAGQVLDNPAWQEAFANLETSLVDKFKACHIDGPTLVDLKYRLDTLYEVQAVLQEFLNTHRAMGDDT